MTTTGIKEWGRRLASLAAIAMAAGAGGGCYITSGADSPTPLPCDPSVGGGPGLPGGGGLADAGVPIIPEGTGDGGVARRDTGAGAAGSALPHAPDPAASCTDVSIDRFKELMIIDPAVLADPRASNASPVHPWSFRQRLEDLNPDPTAAGPLADAWLEQWKSLSDVPATADAGASSIPITARPSVDPVLRCAWLQLSYENACDATCGSCSSRKLDLAQAPFRLLAIANRIDLASGGACGSDGGEMRLVYGAAAPRGGMALPLTVIFEYRITLRPGEALRDWAAAWHALGASAGGADLAARLDAVVAQGLARATLRRVLSNDGAFGPPLGLPWEMRQFVPAATDAGVTRLVEVAVAQTPRLTLASSADLGQWIDANASSVLMGDNRLDARFLASSAPIPSPDFAWHTAASDPAVGAAFNHNTCNGCHGGRAPDDIPFQHVAAPVGGYYDSGSSGGGVRLSKVLNNPGHDDELAHRQTALAAALCGRCDHDGGY